MRFDPRNVLRLLGGLALFYALCLLGIILFHFGRRSERPRDRQIWVWVKNKQPQSTGVELVWKSASSHRRETIFAPAGKIRSVTLPVPRVTEPALLEASTVGSHVRSGSIAVSANDSAEYVVTLTSRTVGLTPRLAP